MTPLDKSAWCLTVPLLVSLSSPRVAQDPVVPAIDDAPRGAESLR
jgi:hypothetical protein